VEIEGLTEMEDGCNGAGIGTAAKLLCFKVVKIRHLDFFRVE
jgi:hypothetical protein